MKKRTKHLAVLNELLLTATLTTTAMALTLDSWYVFYDGDFFHYRAGLFQGCTFLLNCGSIKHVVLTFCITSVVMAILFMLASLSVLSLRNYCDLQSPSRYSTFLRALAGFSALQGFFLFVSLVMYAVTAYEETAFSLLAYGGAYGVSFKLMCFPMTTAFGAAGLNTFELLRDTG